MIERYPRDWDGKEWEKYSLQLVRERYGAANVQPVPAGVKGDLGIECITADGSVYQSYAPEETANVAKSSSAMKQKASRDLDKLKINSQKIEKLLCGLKIKRWFLLCPFLDDKDVVIHVATKAQELLNPGLPFLDCDFRGYVHCQEDFAKEINRLRLEACGKSLKLITPNQTEIAAKGNLIDRSLTDKLGRGFPNDTPTSTRKSRFIKTHIRSENALDQLKRDAPVLWEKAASTIALEEDRLETSGTGSNPAGDLLNQEQDRLHQALLNVLPTLDPNVIRAIALGQMGTWLIECPLDFQINRADPTE